MENKKTKGKAKSAKSEKRSPLGVARRGVWYLLRLLLIITLSVSLCYAALVEAMYISNIYIIVSEGMEMRADCILGNISKNELSEHFDENWLIRDEQLESGKYDAYRIDSYDYRLSI